MSSANTERTHVELLNKLLSTSVLECLRTPVLSPVSSSSSKTSEEQGPTEVAEEEVQEDLIEEEAKTIFEEAELESPPEIFPTPSLRLVLPEHIRVIEKQNRIHVLPDEFKAEINPNLIPKISSTPQQRYIDILADLTGCTRFKSSRAEFWFLDTLANLLRRAQEDGLERPTQATLILWFCEWMKEMQYFDAADRMRMIRRFEDNMIAASKYIVSMGRIPTPAQIGVTYKPQESQKRSDASGGGPISRTTPTPITPIDSKTKVRFGAGGSNFDCCIRDLAKIIHYIFDLFSTDYQYNLVRSIFTFTPEYTLIEAPQQIQIPKRAYAPLKPKKPEKVKKDKDKDKSKQKKKKEEPPNQAYLDFLEKKTEADRIQEEQELLESEQWNRKSHILPLGFAVAEDFFDKYWPPSPPPAPVDEPTISSKKGKKGGKK